MYNKVLHKTIKQMIKEYLKVKEISQIKKMTARNVRKIIAKLMDEKSEYMIQKDKNGEWLVHHLLLSNFNYKRKVAQKYYALSFDPVNCYSERDIDKIMKFVFEQMKDDNIEINYTIEKKKENNRNHLHCFMNCQQRKKFIRMLRVGFSELSYKEDEIYDLEGWKAYITKDGSPITTIKK